MSSPIKNVIIIGGSGSIGPATISALISSGFIVSVLTRESSTATFPTNVTVHRTDYSTQSLLEAFKGQDAVISAIATLSIAQQASIIDAAVTAGVKRFIPSEYGVDTTAPEILEVLPLAKGKKDTVSYLKTKESLGLSWTAICVGAFFDWAFQSPGLMGWNIPARKATIFDDGTYEYESTNLAQIARTIAAVLKLDNLEETKNKYIYVNSFTVTQNQVLGVLEKLTGDKFQVEKASTKETSTVGLEKMKKAEGTGSGDGVYETIVAAIYGNGGVNNFSKTRGLWNKRLGLPEEDLEASLAEILGKAGKSGK